MTLLTPPKHLAEVSEREQFHAQAMERFLDLYRDYPPLTSGMLASMAVVHFGSVLWDLQHHRAAWWVPIFGQHAQGTLITFGARSAARVAQGDLWRLLTSGFVHGDFIHLGVNCLALVGLGRLGEAVFGPTRFLWIFLSSVVGGALMAQITGSPLSFGASGGLFGVTGALVMVGWTRQQDLPPKLVSVLGKQLALWTLLNLVVGFLLPFISSSSHVGGLLVGIGLGAIFKDRITEEDKDPHIVLALCCFFVLLLSFGALILS